MSNLSWPTTSASAYFWRAFFFIFASYYAALGYAAGLRNDNLWFDVDAFLSSAYFFCAAKSHSRAKRLRRRND